MATYFSEQLKSLRKTHDLTQEQMADIFHVSPQSVSRWETGMNYPDVELLPHIAGFFKVSVDELLGTEIILGEEKAADYRKEIRNLLNGGKLPDAMHHLDRMDQTNEQGGNYYPWPTTRNLCWILWEDHLAKPQFDSIRSDEKFLACFALLKANAGALQ